jgi:hypothetical protein
MNPRALIPAVAILLLAGVACSDDDDDTAQVESVVESAPGSGDESTASAGDDDGGGTENDGGGGGTEDGGGDAPAGSARTELPASLNDTRLVPLRIDVVRLERTGELVELELQLTNEADPSGQDAPGFTPYGHFSDYVSTTDVSAVGLLEQGEQKIYLPVWDSGSRCLCSDDLSVVTIAAGESYPLNATFGGVPDDVDTLDVRVPEFPIISGIEVEG